MTDESIGIRVVSQITREMWKCLWQEFQSRNDKGIDGLILIVKNDYYYEILNVQVKTGNGYISSQDDKYIHLNLGKEYITKHRERWNLIPGLVILVYVDPSTDKIMPKAWWVNLKDEDTYSSETPSLIKISKQNRFHESSKGDILKLSPNRHIPALHSTIIVSRSEINIFQFSKSIKETARNYYNDWARSSVESRTHNFLGEIKINRVGWRHITRKKRKTERIYASFLLLPVAKKMLKSNLPFYRVGQAKTRNIENGKEILHYLVIRAQIKFPHRSTSVVTVVLLRSRKINLLNGDETSKTWFYSIFESRRGK